MNKPQGITLVIPHLGPYGTTFLLRLFQFFRHQRVFFINIPGKRRSRIQVAACQDYLPWATIVVVVGPHVG